MLEKSLVFVVGLMPLLIMTGQTLPSPAFYLLLLCSLAILVQYRGHPLHGFYQKYRVTLLCLAAPALAVLFSSMVNAKLAGPDLEAALRFLLGFWILGLAFTRINPAVLGKALCGFMLAALVASLIIIVLALASPLRPDTPAYNAVGYGSLTGLLMALVAFSLPWRLSPWPRAESMTKLVLVGLGLLAVILVQTRTALLAFPIFIVVACLLYMKPHRRVRALVLAVGMAVLLSAVFAVNGTWRQRVVDAYQEAVTCSGEQSTADTSICIRLQLWRASLDMLAQRPVAGMGSKRYFNDYLNQESLPAGVVSPSVAEGWGEPHNDIMLALTSYGVPGGIALLLVFLGPAGLFLRRLAFHHPAQARAAAAMGLSLTLGFLVFGLTETMFRGMRTIGFYSMSLALFMILSDPDRYARSARP